MFLPVLAAPSTKGATPLLLRLAASLLMLVTGQASAMDMRSAPKLGAMEATRCVTPAAQYHSVNPWVLRAILKVESGFNPGAINRNPNNTVDVGIAQMNSMHFKELQQHGVAPGHLLDGCIATYVAAWHLAKQMRVHGNTWFGISDLRRDNVRIRQRGGCEKCGYSGIVGRTTCAELLVPDATFLAHLRSGNEAAARAHWHSDPALGIEDLGVTAVAHAIQKMRLGQLDPADIETQIGPLIVKYASVAGMPERAPSTGSMDRFSGIRMGDDAPSGLMQ